MSTDDHHLWTRLNNWGTADWTRLCTRDDMIRISADCVEALDVIHAQANEIEANKRYIETGNKALANAERVMDKSAAEIGQLCRDLAQHIGNEKTVIDLQAEVERLNGMLATTVKCLTEQEQSTTRLEKQIARHNQRAELASLHNWRISVDAGEVPIVQATDRLRVKLAEIRARALNLAQWLDKGCEPKHGAIEAGFIALMAKTSDDTPAESIAETTKRLQAQHERDCAVEDIARLVSENEQLRMDLTQYLGNASTAIRLEAERAQLMIENKRLAQDIGNAYHAGFEDGYAAGTSDVSVRLREAIDIVKLHATTEHWAWIREVESELSDDVTTNPTEK